MSARSGRGRRVGGSRPQCYRTNRVRGHQVGGHVGATMDVKRNGPSPTSKTKGTCRELLEIEPALWTFTRTAGVEPTNNLRRKTIASRGDAEKDIGRESVGGRNGVDGAAADGGDDDAIAGTKPTPVFRGVGASSACKNEATVASAAGARRRSIDARPRVTRCIAQLYGPILGAWRHRRRPAHQCLTSLTTATLR